MYQHRRIGPCIFLMDIILDRENHDGKIERTFVSNTALDLDGFSADSGCYFVRCCFF